MARLLSGRQVVLAVIASAGLALALCLGLGMVLLIGGVGFVQQITERDVDVVDRIAVLGTDGSLYMIDRQGENLEYLAVSGDGAALAHPTWSPDGRRVAFIARREADDGVESILYTVSTAGGAAVTLYASTDNPAFYLYWSPDSRYVSFLTQEDFELALRLAPADGSESARVMERGSPFYWSWSPDGREVLMHIGGDQRLGEEARLAILAGQPESVPDVLDDAPVNFQAPAWSPDGKKLLYAGREKNGDQALYVRQRAGGTIEKLVNVSGFVRFNWSPDGRWIAYQQIEDPITAPLGHVFVMPATANGSAGERRQVSRDLALAFFWSPDSQRLAVLTLSLGEEEPSTRSFGLAAPEPQARDLLFRWWLADMPDGTLRPLVSFRPTREFLAIVPYFDQYAHSIRFWSPDSRYLAYSHQESEQQAGIWVAGVEGEEPPRRLTDGTLAVWSWQ